MKSYVPYRLLACGRAFGLALVLTFGVVAGVSAGSNPVRTVYPLEEDGLSSLLTAACGFPVERHVSGSLATLVWLDASGQPSRTTYTFPHLTFVLSANGHVLTGNVSGPAFEQYSPDGSMTVIGVGTTRFTTAPGSGPVFGLAGRTVEVLDAGGNPISSDFNGTEGDIAAACVFFAS